MWIWKAAQNAFWGFVLLSPLVIALELLEVRQRIEATNAHLDAIEKQLAAIAETLRYDSNGRRR